MPLFSSRPLPAALSMTCAALMLTACGGGGGVDSDRSDLAAATSTFSQPANTNGRLLASNCFQCHGTGGVGGFERIRGGEAHEIREYLGRAASSSIMAAHAQGYTPAQIDAIVAYLQQ